VRVQLYDPRQRVLTEVFDLSRHIKVRPRCAPFFLHLPLPPSRPVWLPSLRSGIRKPSQDVMSQYFAKVLCCLHSYRNQLYGTFSRGLSLLTKLSTLRLGGNIMACEYSFCAAGAVGPRARGGVRLRLLGDSHPKVFPHQARWRAICLCCKQSTPCLMG
jgi:hypothetical protein